MDVIRLLRDIDAGQGCRTDTIAQRLAVLSLPGPGRPVPFPVALRAREPNRPRIVDQLAHCAPAPAPLRDVPPAAVALVMHHFEAGPRLMRSVPRTAALPGVRKRFAPVPRQRSPLGGGRGRGVAREGAPPPFRCRPQSLRARRSDPASRYDRPAVSAATPDKTTCAKSALAIGRTVTGGVINSRTTRRRMRLTIFATVRPNSVATAAHRWIAQ